MPFCSKRFTDGKAVQNAGKHEKNRSQNHPFLVPKNTVKKKLSKYVYNIG